MSDEPRNIDRRAEDLRRSFDQSFETASNGETALQENFLAIRMAEDPYAVRLSEISGLFLDKVITPLPGSVSGLLGVAAFRGAMMPVYDLRVLLGYLGGGSPRWPVSASLSCENNSLRSKRTWWVWATRRSFSIIWSTLRYPTQATTSSTIA